MAKKSISRNSRAARRGEVDRFESSEAKELKAEPRLETTDKVSPLIRSSLEKNQQLLKDKLQSKAARKKELLNGMRTVVQNGVTKKSTSSLVSKTIKSKQRKFTSIDGRLGHKIDASIRKNRMVSNLRKTGWEKINELAKNSLNDELISKMDSVKKTDLDVEEEIAEEMRMELEEEDELSSKFVEKPNVFAMLQEENN